MGKKGGSTCLKRKPAPRFWPIHRKEFPWIVKPSAGPHSLEKCLSLTIVLRDILGSAKTRKEARTIIVKRKVCVDGRVICKENFPVGLMDVISIEDINKYFRMLPSRKGLILHPISKKETGFKLSRIEDKRVVRKKNIQLNLHDGSNMLVEITDPENPQEDIYKTLDTVKISLPERQILEQIEMKEKDFVLVTGGKNIGKHGKIVEIEETKGKKHRNNLVTIEDESGSRYQTILDFTFVIGKEKPLISLPEVVHSV